MENKAPLELSIVIPAYNEARRIGRTLPTIDQYLRERGWRYEILVVDDGSKDRTADLVKGMALPSVRLLAYGENRGKGYAVNFGLKHGRGKWRLFTDADSSTPIEELEKLWREKDRYPIVIGSRYRPESQITQKQPFLRRAGSRLGNLLTRALILPGISDTQCGFKLFSQSALEKILPLQTVWRWGFDMEILRIAKEHKLPIKEVGVIWQNDELSKIQSPRVFWQTLCELLAIKINSLLGKYSPSVKSKTNYFFKFAVVGAVGTLLDYAILNFSHLVLGLNIYLAIGLGFLIGALNNYLLNSLWTFRQRLTWQQLTQFVVVAIGGWLWTELIVYVLTKAGGWHYNWAKLLAVIIVFFWNYLVNRHWTFRQKHQL